MGLKEDRNFDSLADKFEQKIYSTAKGAWRLHLLKEDLAFLNDSALEIWDAGCGFAQISQWLAEQGHRLTLCDISKKMLHRAQQNFQTANLTATFHHQSAQSLARQLDSDFDLLIFHAVLEWMSNPIPSLLEIIRKVRPNGFLSLLFYNRNAMIYTNALKGGWRIQHLLDEDYMGQGSKLTPPNPQYPHEILSLLKQNGFSLIKHTGIRIFHDYLSPEVLQQTDQEGLFELEYRYCRMPVYRDMGRYVHILLQR